MDTKFWATKDVRLPTPWTDSIILTTRGESLSMTPKSTTIGQRAHDDSQRRDAWTHCELLATFAFTLLQINRL